MIKAFGRSEFNLKMIEKGISVVEKIVSEKFDQSMKIKFNQDPEPEPAKKAVSNNEKTQSQPDDENTLNRIVELFDGEILH